MTKKIIIIALAFVLCLSIIGVCFAVHIVDAKELNITFGSEDAVRLTLNPGTLSFGGVKLNPSEGHRSASQAITLDVTTADKASLTGMSGQLTVSVTGALANSLDLSAVADEVSYTQDQLTSGVILPLNALPKNFTLTVSLKDDIDDDSFKAISKTTASITVSWKVVDWAPVDGAYYIVGSFNGWTVNSKAIKMDAPAEGSTSLAEWYGTFPAGTAFKCVQYTVVDGEANMTWFDIAYAGEWGSPKVDVYGDEEGGVTASGGNLIAPESGEEIFVCVNTEDGGHYSWGQTKASMNATPAE